MKQTLLAICGLVLTMLLAVSLQRNAVRGESSKVSTEIETLAGHAALDVLAHIAAQPFDANTAAGAVSTPADLTPASAFPTGLAFAAAADVDDFHRMATLDRTAGPDSLTFQVDAEVAYVTETAQPSAAPTYQKAVTVTVRHAHLGHPVVLRRVVSWP